LPVKAPCAWVSSTAGRFLTRLWGCGGKTRCIESIPYTPKVLFVAIPGATELRTREGQILPFPFYPALSAPSLFRTRA